MRRMVWTLVTVLALATISGCGSSQRDSGKTVESTAKRGDAIELLNVSYDPTRELWKQINKAFIDQYTREHATELNVKQSHGGSSTQARAVIDGLDADVVTLAMYTDTDAIAKKGLIKTGWVDRLPNGSLPYSSTIVFVVRKGNPKGIHDWPDLLRKGVQVVTPNPKTSGNGKLSFLAAWGSVLASGGSEQEAQEFVTKLYQPDKVPVLDSGARGSTATFAQKGIGDVHLTWENEAHLEKQEAGDQLEIVYPKSSIRAEPRVAVVDANVDRKGTRAAAEAYLKFLYTDEGQRIIAANHYRPYKEEFSESFPKIELFEIKKIAESWDAAEERFFKEGGVFDKIYSAKKSG